MSHRCEGMCDACRGEVIAVTVYHPDTLRDWGLYFYCQNAIEEDRKRGLDVTRVINTEAKCYESGF